MPARPPDPKGWWRTAALALGVTIVMVTPLQVTAGPSTKEVRVFRMINSARNSRGLAPLALRDNLVRMARRHSSAMSRQNLLFHSACLSCRFPAGSWSALAENVGTGGSLRGVHRSMMRSAGHRQNLLGGFDAIGVGVVKRGGRFWVTEIFYS